LRRFAFVEFDSEESASAAIEEHNSEEVDGRELHVSPASIGGKSSQQQSASLYSRCSVLARLYRAVCLLVVHDVACMFVLN